MSIKGEHHMDLPKMAGKCPKQILQARSKPCLSFLLLYFLYGVTYETFDRIEHITWVFSSMPALHVLLSFRLPHIRTTFGMQKCQEYVFTVLGIRVVQGCNIFVLMN